MISDLVITDMTVRERKMRVCARFSGTELIDLKVRPTGFSEIVGSVYCGVIEKISKSAGSAMVRLSGGEALYLPLNGKDLRGFDKVAVQIVREGDGRKEALCSTELTFAGRYAVLTSGGKGVRVSKKLSADARGRLLKLAEEKHLSREDIGILFRTAAGTAEEADLVSEIASLTDTVNSIRDRLPSASPGKLLYQAPAVWESMYLDMDADTRIQTDIPSVADRFGVECRRDRSLSLAALKGLDTAVERLLQKKVHLRSGGFLLVERTEAFHVIDVNTGNAVKGKDPESLFLRTDLEAAEESARQIRLRNLSGIILIDFIDLKEPGHRAELIRRMEECLKSDPVPGKIVDLTGLHIMEITRQKKDRPLADYFD